MAKEQNQDCPADNDQCLLSEALGCGLWVIEFRGFGVGSGSLGAICFEDFQGGTANEVLRISLEVPNPKIHRTQEVLQMQRGHMGGALRDRSSCSGSILLRHTQELMGILLVGHYSGFKDCIEHRGL